MRLSSKAHHLYPAILPYLPLYACDGALGAFFILRGKMKRSEVYAIGLPCSFNYLIRREFYSKPCPVCGAKMERDREFGTRKHIPTIQHNTPISKGGLHEIENISVICLSCNTSLRNTVTGMLNNSEVVSAWKKIKG